MKQTAVEWLIEELGEYFPHEIGGIEWVVRKAKEMEKEQIVKAYIADSVLRLSTKAEQYYNQTFNTNG
jgi:hypothetical protein